MIVDNADDVVTALKCCGLRHMDRRLRLTAHLEEVLDEVPRDLPTLLDRRERAYYLQGTFFNTAVVQSSEATAHLLMALAGRVAAARGARRRRARRQPSRRPAAVPVVRRRPPDHHRRT